MTLFEASVADVAGLLIRLGVISAVPLEEETPTLQLANIEIREPFGLSCLDVTSVFVVNLLTGPSLLLERAAVSKLAEVGPLWYA